MQLRAEVIKVNYNKLREETPSDLKLNLLPSVKANSRMNSVDVDRIERERRIAAYV